MHLLVCFCRLFCVSAGCCEATHVATSAIGQVNLGSSPTWIPILPPVRHRTVVPIQCPSGGVGCSGKTLLGMCTMAPIFTCGAAFGGARSCPEWPATWGVGRASSSPRLRFTSGASSPDDDSDYSSAILFAAALVIFAAAPGQVASSRHRFTALACALPVLLLVLANAILAFRVFCTCVSYCVIFVRIL